MSDELFQNLTNRADQRAREELIRQYQPLVRSVCRRYLRDPNDIEDATQDTFVKMIRREREVEGSLASWLTAVACSTSIDLIRRAGGRLRRQQGLARRGAMTYDPAVSVAMHQHLQNALSEMEPRARELIVERFYRQTPLRVLAGNRRVSVPTMSRHVAAATRQLAEILRDMGADSDGVTIAEHFGAFSSLPGTGEPADTGLRFAPDWQSADLLPYGASISPAHPEGWSRPIRIGAVLGYGSAVFGGGDPRFSLDMQLLSMMLIGDPGFQLVGVVEPSTSGKGLVERALRDYQLTGGLIEADDLEGLKTLDILLLGIVNILSDSIAEALVAAVRSGVGLLNEYWSGANTDRFDDPHVLDLMLADSPVYAFHTIPCGPSLSATVLCEDAMLPGLTAGTKVKVRGCGPAYRLKPDARLLIAKDHCIEASEHGIPSAGSLTMPVYALGTLGRGRVAVVHAWPHHQQLMGLLSAKPQDYLRHLLRWLAEPKKIQNEDSGRIR